MKNIIRAFALSLVVTGAVASTHIANHSQKTVGPLMSDLPPASCDPNDPNACGICQISGNCTSTN